MNITLGEHKVIVEKSRPIRLWRVRVLGQRPDDAEYVYSASEYISYYNSPSRLPKRLWEEAAQAAWTRLKSQHPELIPYKVYVEYTVYHASTPVTDE